MDEDGRSLPFMDSPLASTFERRVVLIAPGQAVAYVDDEWRGALVVVERGDVDFECRAGGTRRFVCGDVLWMDGLELRWLCNPGLETTALVAISRRAGHNAAEAGSAPSAEPSPPPDQTCC